MKLVFLICAFAMSTFGQVPKNLIQIKGPVYVEARNLQPATVGSDPQAKKPISAGKPNTFEYLVRRQDLENQLSDAAATSYLNDIPSDDLPQFSVIPYSKRQEDQPTMLSAVDMAKRSPGIGVPQARELFDDLRVERDDARDDVRPMRRQYNGEPSRWLWLKTGPFHG